MSGITPQLLNPIVEIELPFYLSDPSWCMQQKFDGKRLLIQVKAGTASGINRKGLFIPLPAPWTEEAATLDSNCLLDGEAVGNTFHCFDLLTLGGECLRHLPYADRLQRLGALLSSSKPKSIQLVQTFLAVEEKARMFEQLRLERAEGVVFKRLGAPYSPGRLASGGDQLKHKFYASASFVVAGLNKTKRSVRLVLFKDAQQVEAGNVTIPPNHPVPGIGNVVEVRYLYANLGNGIIYQPVFLGLREDVPFHDCTTTQLKYRQEMEE